MKLKIRITIILLFISFPIVRNLAQVNGVIKLPAPQIGWDSLQNKITYPEIAKRAVIWGSYEVTIEIDSTGKMVNCKIGLANYELNDCKDKMSKYDSLFINYLKYVFQDLEWNPGQIDGGSKTMEITVPLVFYFDKRRRTAPTLFIKSNPEYPIIN